MSFLYRDNLDRYVSEVRSVAMYIPTLRNEDINSIIYGLAKLIQDPLTRRQDDGICYSLGCLIGDQSMTVDFTLDCATSWRLFDSEDHIYYPGFEIYPIYNSNSYPIRVEALYFSMLYAYPANTSILNKTNYWDGVQGFFRKDLLAHCYDIAMAESIYRERELSHTAE